MLLTVGWVIVVGLFRFSVTQAFAFPPQAYTVNRDLFAATGTVALLAMYNYGGYNNVQAARIRSLAVLRPPSRLAHRSYSRRG